MIYIGWVYLFVALLLLSATVKHRLKGLAFLPARRSWHLHSVLSNAVGMVIGAHLFVAGQAMTGLIFLAGTLAMVAVDTLSLSSGKPKG